MDNCRDLDFGALERFCRGESTDAYRIRFPLRRLGHLPFHGLGAQGAVRLPRRRFQWLAARAYGAAGLRRLVARTLRRA